MVVDRRAARVSVGIGGTAALLYLASLSGLVFGFPFSSGPTVLPFFDTRFDVVQGFTLLFVLVLPHLLAAVGAFHTATDDDHPVGAVVLGFGLGGLRYGTGLLTAWWLVSSVSLHAVEGLLGRVVPLVCVFVAMASLGALGGDLADGRLRGAAGPR